MLYLEIQFEPILLMKKVAYPIGGFNKWPWAWACVRREILLGGRSQLGIKEMNPIVSGREPAEDDRLRSEGLELQGLQRAFDPRDQRTVYVNIVSLTPLLTLSIDEPRSRTRTPSQLRSFHRYFAIIYMEAMEMFFLLSGNN